MSNREIIPRNGADISEEEMFKKESSDVVKVWMDSDRGRPATHDILWYIVKRVSSGNIGPMTHCMDFECFSAVRELLIQVHVGVRCVDINYFILKGSHPDGLFRVLQREKYSWGFILGPPPRPDICSIVNVLRVPSQHGSIFICSTDADTCIVSCAQTLLPCHTP